MDQKIKVFYINPMSYNNLALYDYSLISNIHGAEVKYYGNSKYEIKNDDVEIEKIYAYSDKKGIFKFFSYLNSHRILLKEIKKEKPDIVHFQWIRIPTFDYYFIKHIKRLGIKVIITAHNILPHDTGEKYAAIYGKLYKALDAIIVHSETTKIDLEQKFGLTKQKINVIPHGILSFYDINDINENEIEQYMADFRKKHIKKNEIVFSVLGNFSKYKGTDMVIDAWLSPEIHKNQKIKLIIAGAGTNDKLEELKNCENVIIKNHYLETSEFIALLRITDYLLLPYKQISQSGILLTSLNEKVKVIVSNIGGLTDPFRFGDIGYIMDEVSVEGLKSTINKAATEPNVTPEKEIWDNIFDYYHWKNIGFKTRELYRQLT